MKRSVTSMLFQAARLSADMRAVSKTVQTGNPKYVARRLVNKGIGRAAARAGLWNLLWGGKK